MTAVGRSETATHLYAVLGNGHPTGPVHPDIRRVAHRWLDGPLEGTAVRQPHLPADTDIHRVSAT